MAEQQYTIHLNNVVRIPSTRKANRAIFAIKQFVKKHTHAKVENIRLSTDVNHVVWARGKEHKVSRLDVVLRKEKDIVHVFTPDGEQLKAFEKKKAPAKKEVKAEKKAEAAPATEKAPAPKKAAHAEAKK